MKISPQKSRKNKIYFGCLAFLFFLNIINTSSALAGAWLSAPKQWSSINTLGYTVYDSGFDRFGDENDQKDLIKYEFKSFNEYGIDEKNAVIITPVFQAVILQDAFFDGDYFADKNMAFTDIDFGYKRKVAEYLNGKIVVSNTALLNIPGIYNETQTPTFGKKETFWRDEIELGWSAAAIKDIKVFGNLLAGARGRISDAFEEENGLSVKLEPTFGVERAKKTIYLQFTYENAFENLPQNNVYLNRYGYDIFKYKLAVVENFDFANLEFAYTEDISGKNTGKAEVFSFGLWKKYSFD